MKTRILMINECSVLSTGYSTYGKEILSRLYNNPNFEVAEFATYIHHSDNRLNSIPWRVYANLPDQNNEEQQNAYNSKATNQFGEWRFDEICLNFRPHVVFNILDFWMCEHVFRSPLRKYYNCAWMPTIDAAPQNEQWLQLMQDADGIFTYSNWAKDTIKKQACNINFQSVASPSATPEISPLDPETVNNAKMQLGLEGKTIIGTVMRNQRRKLYPDLFKAFRRLLDKTQRSDILLYCHTSYPDMGWDIPKLLLQYGISNKVLFTYKCRSCGHAYPSYFCDAIQYCVKCKNKTSALVNVQNGVDNKHLNLIYNIFDVYVQLSNSEGFGMPQVEAAAAGVPVLATDYSAMSDVVRNLNGFPVPCLTTILEPETGCYRAVPDVNFLVNKLENIVGMIQDQPDEYKNLVSKTLEGFRTHYSSWDKTYESWEQYFSNIDPEHYEKLWNSPANIHTPKNRIDDNCSNNDYVEWLLSEVLGEPERIGTYMHARLLRDLNYESTIGGAGGVYFNESAQVTLKPNVQEFDRNLAYRHMMDLLHHKNHIEQQRTVQR